MGYYFFLYIVYEDVYDRVKKSYSPSPYKGENALHMAIANNFSLETITDLLKRSSLLVHGRATGSFFRPSTTSVTCPFGEYPLSFAVSLNRPHIVKLLVLQGGANVLARDSDGNTAMHLAVYHKRKEMIELLDILWKFIQHYRKLIHNYKQHNIPIPTNISNIIPNMIVPLYEYDNSIDYDLQLTQIPNNEGYTPLVYAAKYGHIDMFKYVWERARDKAWNYWHVTAYKYPLEHIDDIWDLLKLKLHKENNNLLLQQQPNNNHNTSVSTITNPNGIEDSESEDDDKQKPRIREPPPKIPEINHTLLNKKRKSIVTIEEKTGKRKTDFGYLSARTALQLLTDEDFDFESDEIPVLRELLDHKWIRYARWKFLLRFLIIIAYLIIFIITVSIRGHRSHVASELFDRTPTLLNNLGFGHFAMCCTLAFPTVTPWKWWSNTVSNTTDVSNLLCNVGTIGEVIIVSGAIIKLCETLIELYRVGVYYFFHSRGATKFERYMSILFSGSVLSTVIFEFFQIDYWSKLFLSFASVLGPFYLLWFLLGFRLTGPFVVMMYLMFTKDLAQFLSIAIILLIGFTQAFFIQSGHQGFTLFFRNFLIVFNDMVGADPRITLHNQEDEIHLGHIQDHHIVAHQNNQTYDNNNNHSIPLENNHADNNFTFLGFWIMYILLANVVLLNLLVAMMGDTYTKIRDKAAAQWFLERTRIILQIETWMSKEERLSESNAYYGVHIDKKTGKSNIYLQSEHKDDDKFLAKNENEVTEQVKISVTKELEQWETLYSIDKLFHNNKYDSTTTEVSIDNNEDSKTTVRRRGQSKKRNN